MKFVIIDQGPTGNMVATFEADTVEEAADMFAPKAQRPLHIDQQNPIVWSVVDDITFEGWGEGCKYEADATLFNVVERICNFHIVRVDTPNEPEDPELLEDIDGSRPEPFGN